MALQYFLQEGVEGSENLKRLYKDLNNEFFGGSLPTIPVKWSGRLKRAVGQAACSYKRNSLSAGKSHGFEKYMKEIPIANVEINMSTLGIKLSTGFDLQLPDVKAILLHEMVHIKLYTQKKLGGHHDTPEFDGWIRKLSAQSGLNVPHKESEFKSSPKLQAKQGWVLIIFQINGNKGLSTYSNNFMTNQDKFMGFMEMLQRLIKHSSKVNRVELYQVTHPIVTSMSPKRSAKGLSWQNTDDETVLEIQRQGKKVTELDKHSNEQPKPEPEPELSKKKKLSADDIALLKSRGGTGRVTTKRYGY